MIYNNDIAHCAGEGCSIKTLCYRYLLHREFHTKKKFETAPYVTEHYSIFTKSCCLFLDKNSNNIEIAKL
jgi:hypothetical protein